MDHSHLAILLLILGIALLVAEVFIPSGGIILVMALACLGGSIAFAIAAWKSSPVKLGIYISALILFLPSALAGALYLFPRTEWGRRILLQAPNLDELTPYTKEQERLHAMIGKFGKTATLLNPGGLVVIDGERLHCESEGMLVESGQPVRVLAVRGNRLVVRVTDGSEEEAESRKVADQSDQPPEPWLDFEVPQS